MEKKTNTIKKLLFEFKDKKSVDAAARAIINKNVPAAITVRSLPSIKSFNILIVGSDVDEKFYTDILKSKIETTDTYTVKTTEVAAKD